MARACRARRLAVRLTPSADHARHDDPDREHRGDRGQRLGAKELSGDASHFASWVGLGCRSSFAIFRATFWRSYMRLCRHVRKSVASVTPDASEVKREYRYKQRYGEVTETENPVSRGAVSHLSVIFGTHSVDDRWAQPVAQLDATGGPDARPVARLGRIRAAPAPRLAAERLDRPRPVAPPGSPKQSGQGEGAGRRLVAGRHRAAPPLRSTAR